MCRGDFRGGSLIWVEDVDLTWQDNASTETGYVVYKNRVPQGALPAGTAKYHLQFRYAQGGPAAPPDSFAVEAMRGGVASARATVELPHCP